MRIGVNYRAVMPGDPFIGVHRNGCFCSLPKCGSTETRTMGYTVYLGKISISIIFDKPKGCGMPF